jgi:hypothetical protein
MAAKIPIRVIKRDQRAPSAKPVQAVSEKGGALEMAARQVKTVVAGWVHDRQEQRLDPRRAFAELFRTA